MMNNFMPSNLPQAFYNVGGPAGKNSSQNYSYDINLNAVNKSTGPSTTANTNN